ncbi:hypothetical protein BHE90_005795, partial [Fusarium euwallaceae]
MLKSWGFWVYGWFERYLDVAREVLFLRARVLGTAASTSVLVLTWTPLPYTEALRTASLALILNQGQTTIKASGRSPARETFDIHQPHERYIPHTQEYAGPIPRRGRYAILILGRAGRAASATIRRRCEHVSRPPGPRDHEGSPIIEAVRRPIPVAAPLGIGHPI